MNTSRLLTILLVGILMLTALTSCATTAKVENTAVLANYEEVRASVLGIMKYGNIVLDQPADELLAKGYDYGDVLKIKIGGKTVLAPLCTNYSDVNVGENVAITNDGYLIVAINMGDFATTNGLAKKEKHADGSYEWIPTHGSTLSEITLTVSMEKKAGYRTEYLLHNLVRTNDRADYQTDEIFANFRAVSLGKLGKNALYRSSSPINPSIGRSLYADELTKNAGIRCVLNLAETPIELGELVKDEQNGSTYYKSLVHSGDVIALGLSVDFKAPDFTSGIIKGLTMLAEEEGPYLIHCNEGKDRAGFVCALLEALMGTKEAEIIKDYMVSYSNFYNIEAGSEKYEAVKASTIVPILQYLKGDTISVQKGAEIYLLKAGMEPKTLAQLKANLAKNY